MSTPTYFPHNSNQLHFFTPPPPSFSPTLVLSCPSTTISDSVLSKEESGGVFYANTQADEEAEAASKDREESRKAVEEVEETEETLTEIPLDMKEAEEVEEAGEGKEEEEEEETAATAAAAAVEPKEAAEAEPGKPCSLFIASTCLRFTALGFLF